MKISILISSYNKGSFLEKCIQSCLNQKYKDYEIILIDNESTDNTNSILKNIKMILLLDVHQKLANILQLIK